MKGFTLIEVVVSISIALLVTGLIIANYNTYNDVQTLKQAALTLKNDLRFVQSKASSGEKPTAGCAQLEAWVISFTLNTYSYQLQCTDGLVGTATQKLLPSGVTFSPVPSTFSIRVLTKGTTLPDTTLLSLIGSGKRYSITINTSGEISDVGLQ
jgi:prepilin-type N-terminal cleavage/methylation domain-containing protein